MKNYSVTVTRTSTGKVVVSRECTYVSTAAHVKKTWEKMFNPKEFTVVIKPIKDADVSDDYL